MHALMLVVMVAAMASGSALVSIAGAVLLVTASIVCAALSRSRAFLRDHVVDLWAMALVLLAFLPRGVAAASAGHHAMTVDALLAFWIVVLAWGAARATLVVRSRRSEWVPATASAAFTAAGLAVMAVLCA